MEVDTSALRAQRGRVERHDFVLRDAGFDYGGDRYRMSGPAAVHAELRNTGRSVRADVGGHVDLACTCDRCLDPFSFGVDVSYAEEFLTPAQAADGGEGERDDGRIRRVVCEAATISLDEGFWQNVILSLPMKRLCRPDCRGICPRCGSNRNRDRCSCATRDADPRLAALEQLLPGSAGGSQRPGGL